MVQNPCLTVTPSEAASFVATTNRSGDSFTARTPWSVKLISTIYVAITCFLRDLTCIARAPTQFYGRTCRVRHHPAGNDSRHLFQSVPRHLTCRASLPPLPSPPRAQRGIRCPAPIVEKWIH